MATDEAPDGAAALTEDALLGGRVSLTQPARGYRAAIDPVLLAASLPESGGHAVDLGCGAGAALLCAAVRLPALRLTGVERDPALAALAAANAQRSGVAGRVSVVEADVVALPPALRESADAVLMNPPYLEAARSDPSPVPLRAAAGVEGAAGLADWIAAALGCLVPGGRLHAIHRADRLDGLLAALAGRAGAIVVVPLWPRAGVAAKRVIVTARKGVRTPLRLAPGLVLHREDGRFTDAAEAILRDAGSLAT